MTTESYLGNSPAYTGVGINRHGQCRFVYASTTSCKLYPHNGNQLIINGVSYTIPSGGVNLANSDLASNGTTYYVYAYISSGTMTLEAVATTHATDTSTGIEIKSGDATRTLVGMVRKTGDNFTWTSAARYVATYFNRRNVSLFNTDSTAITTTAQDLAGVAGLLWADDAYVGDCQTSAYNLTGIDNMYVSFKEDSTELSQGYDQCDNGLYGHASATYSGFVSDGYHAFYCRAATIAINAAGGSSRISITYLA